MMYKDPIHTSHGKYYISAIVTNGLLLLREAVAIYCQNQKKHTKTLCGQNNAKFCYVKAGSTYTAKLQRVRRKFIHHLICS
jgi:hypothetical protein